MQKRLFTIFLLLSLVPSTAILLINWQTSQRHLGFLKSPGLSSSLESSLRLARRELARELEKTEVDLENLVVGAGTLPDLDSVSLPAEVVLVFWSTENIPQIYGQPNAALLEELESVFWEPIGSAKRITVQNQDWILAQLEFTNGRLVLARPLVRELSDDLAAVTRGSARLRQTRLYYGDLLRGDTLVTFLLLGLVLLVVALILSRQLARQIAGPVGELAKGTRRVADGDLDHQVVVDAPDELGQLVEAFNLMTDDLRNSKADLVRAERIAAWQGIARRLAHEIKNPLTPVTLAMHRIGKRCDDDAVAESVSAVLEEVENLKRLADEFSQYARLPVPEPEKVDLESLLRSVVELYTQETRLDVVWTNWHEPVFVRVDQGQIRQALANLIKNAVTAMSGQGRLQMTSKIFPHNVAVLIADTGPGLPEPIEKIFEPYFTTKETGTGLGLPIARKIVEDAGGSLSAENSESGGALFTVSLPLSGLGS